MRFQALAIHTEKIHDPLVWKRLRFVLSTLSRKGSRATLFVYPFRAIVAGKSDVALERVKWAWSQGHEVAQHTHFYKGESIDKPERVTDLSGKNVIHCLRRDHAWLSQICRPGGFTSGGWAVPPALYPALVELGFEYDCSARHPALRRPQTPHMVWLVKPELRKFEQGRVLLVPTTHSLKGSLFRFRGGDLETGLNDVRYRIVYFHDYDLLRWEVYLAVWTVILLGGTWGACRDLVDSFRRGWE